MLALRINQQTLLNLRGGVEAIGHASSGLLVHQSACDDTKGAMHGQPRWRSAQPSQFKFYVQV